MTKFLNILKKPCFWPIPGPFSQFFEQKKIFWKIRLPRTTSYGFLASCQNLEKTNDTIPRKRPDRRKDERTDRPYYIGPFQLTLGVQQLYYVMIIYLLNLFLNSALLFFGP